MATSTAIGLGDYLREVDVNSDFRAEPFYEPLSDSLIFYARNVRSYARRVNASLTVFLSMEDNSLVGCEIKGVTHIVERVEQFGVILIDHTVGLGVLVGIAAAAPTDDPTLPEDELMNQLRDVTSEIKVNRNLFCAI